MDGSDPCDGAIYRVCQKKDILNIHISIPVVKCQKFTVIAQLFIK